MIRSSPFRATACLAIAFAAHGAAQAQSTVYRCVDAAGQSAYQEAPCGSAARQSEVKLPAWPPPQPAASRASLWKGWIPPKEAVFTFYYDPAEEPVGYSTAAMEGAIRAAAQAWSSGCNVRIAYGGRAPARLPGTPSFVPVRWAPDLMRARHAADPRSGIAGMGSLATGIELKPRFHDADMASVMVHEMGHVLGLPHNHGDTKSVMSYLRDEATRKGAGPSAGDYLDCNMAMKRQFGIDFTPPAAGTAEPRPPYMTDREALEKINGPRER